jgi:hypothetical protein
MSADHAFHTPHFHLPEPWASIAALPFAIVMLGVAAALVCQVINWS